VNEPAPPVARASADGSRAADRVGWGFIALYALAYMSLSLMLIAPLLVTLPLKIDVLVGIEQAPKALALVAGTGSFLSVFSNPLCGQLSDRTTSRWGMRRPWMLVGPSWRCCPIGSRWPSAGRSRVSSGGACRSRR